MVKPMRDRVFILLKNQRSGCNGRSVPDRLSVGMFQRHSRFRSQYISSFPETSCVPASMETPTALFGTSLRSIAEICCLYRAHHIFCKSARSNCSILIDIINAVHTSPDPAYLRNPDLQHLMPAAYASNPGCTSSNEAAVLYQDTAECFDHTRPSEISAHMFDTLSQATRSE